MKDDNIIEAASRFGCDTSAQLIGGQASIINIEANIPMSFKLIAVIIKCLLTGRCLRVTKPIRVIHVQNPDIRV